jgi:transposase-like protein
MQTVKRSPSRRSRRWSASEARRVLGELERSGLPASRFAARRGLGVERLYAWRRRLRHQAKRPVPLSRFTEVRLAAPPAIALIEVLLPNGTKVRLSGATRVDDAVAVLARVSPR